jgi:phosphate transport system substrate-binding protein
MLSRRRRIAVTFLAVGSLMTVAGCQELIEQANLPPDALRGHLIGAGASSQGSAQEAWVVGFQLQNPGVTVTFDPIGSGGGRETFQSGASLFAASDRAFRLSEIEEGRFDACVVESGIWQIPAYISPIAVIFNEVGAENLQLDAETIAGIFTGKITSWDDPAIAQNNPRVVFPRQNITPVHRSDKSGTTGNFADYLSKAAPDVWIAGGENAGATEEWFPEWRGEGAPQTSGVVDTVANGVGTIGYTDASRAAGLGVVSVRVGDDYVLPSPEAAAAIVDASPIDDGDKRGPGDLAVEIDRTTAASGTYPIVLISYLIGCNEYRDSSLVPILKAYLSYVVSEEGQQFAAEYAGNAPMSAVSRERALAVIEGIR